MEQELSKYIPTNTANDQNTAIETERHTSQENQNSKCVFNQEHH